MKKRVLATALWFYAGWFAGAFVAFMAGVSPVLGPMVGLAAAGLIGGDPFHVIWTRPATQNGAPVGTSPVQNPA